MIEIHPVAYQHDLNRTFLLRFSREGWLSFEELFETGSADFQVA